MSQNEIPPDFCIQDNQLIGGFIREDKNVTLEQIDHFLSEWRCTESVDDCAHVLLFFPLIHKIAFTSNCESLNGVCSQILNKVDLLSLHRRLQELERKCSLLEEENSKLRSKK